MTARQQNPRKGIIAAASSCLVAAVCFAGTAIAAHNATAVEINPKKKDEVAGDELVVPLARATTNAVLEKNNPPPDGGKTPAAQIVVKQPDPAENKVPDLSARIPGISDKGLARFKRQMYRRDI